jgi:hypothetical protein
LEGNVEIGGCGRWGFHDCNIETIDAGLLVLSVRQGNRTSSLTHTRMGMGPIDRFVQGRIWGFEDYLLERMTLEPLLADQQPLSGIACPANHDGAICFLCSLSRMEADGYIG